MILYRCLFVCVPDPVHNVAMLIIRLSTNDVLIYAADETRLLGCAPSLLALSVFRCMMSQIDPGLSHCL